MTLELYLAYVLATTILLLLPGPTVMLVVSYALAEGRRAAWGTVIGLAFGDLVAMSLSLAGIGALLATSATLFTVMKWIGAVYLIYLGIRMWRAAPTIDGTLPAGRSRSDVAMAWHAFVVTALNPKSIAFFVAFVPQFINPQAATLPQLVLLTATFVGLAIVNGIGYALFAGSIREAVRHPRVLRAINRTGGGVLIGAGLMTAALRRTA
jgi:threonine/homoserine/homoserine lactone efflux protein